MARLVAFGDAHLGRTHLAHLRDEAGRNLREEDFLRSFDWAVERALELEPDGVLLLGDLFDHARPSYRSFTRVAVGLRRLHDAGLPGVAISGNHDTPRLRGTGSPYAALEEFLPGVAVAWRMEAMAADLAGDRVLAVPQTLTVEDLRQELDRAAGEVAGDRTNVLIAHVALTSLPARAYPDINELEVAEGEFDRRFDLLVLGHYHVFQKASGRTWYAGATDSFSFADRPRKAGPKGLIVVDTDAGKVEHDANPHERPLVTAGIDAAGMGPGELLEACGREGHGVPEGAIVRVFLNDVDPAAYRQVSQDDFQATIPAALHVQVEPDFAEAALAVQAGAEMGTLEQEWAAYVEMQDLAGLERKRIRGLGERFLVEATGETV